MDPGPDRNNHSQQHRQFRFRVIESLQYSERTTCRQARLSMLGGGGSSQEVKAMFIFDLAAQPLDDCGV